MKKATLTRQTSTDHGTFGLLEAVGLSLYIAEPPWRDNARGLSCVPTGEYIIKPHRSPRYGQCLLVTDTPDRTWILQHPGNVAGDKKKGLHTHTLGCQLPGLRIGQLKVKGRYQQAVLASRTAFRKLMTWADKQPYLLNIIGG